VNELNDDEGKEVIASLRRTTDRPILTLLVMIAAGLVFIWQKADWNQAMDLLAPSGVTIFQGRWDGLFTSVFLHGDLLHIFFNLSWVWLLGRVLEANLSKWFWALLFVTCAVFASAVEFAFADQLGIGLSGVVYGWAGFVWFARARYPAFSGVINQQTAMWLAGWLVFCFVMTKTGSMHIANGAHFGGLVAGSAIGLAMRGSTRRAGLVCLGFLGLTVGSLIYAPWSASYHAAEAIRYSSRDDRAAALRALEKELYRRGKVSHEAGLP
jgi:membrane associated rhomboid family serine protease